MSVHLAAIPVCNDQLDMLTLITDPVTPLGKLHADDFRAACIAVADFHGFVNPNLVSAHLHERFGEINPNWYAASWGPACGPNGFMDKADAEVPIDPRYSLGNGNKAVKWRRLRWAA